MPKDKSVAVAKDKSVAVAEVNTLEIDREPTSCYCCGSVYNTAVLAKGATKDKLRSDRPGDMGQKPQISADCPACGAKRIYIENPRTAVIEQMRTDELAGLRQDVQELQEQLKAALAAGVNLDGTGKAEKPKKSPK